MNHQAAPASFLWHDYETTGTDPGRDRPLQFAAIRTDAALNLIGEPIMLYCKPPRDLLPHPMACLVTGISPQYADAHGLNEAAFVAAIAAEMMQPGTCSVGYNSIRFDDEFTRYSLYRNFYDPYEREWKNGNSRWDLIDVVRLCALVKPQGIAWPKDDEGFASFRLEALTAANGIEQQGAHDALVDVRATIDLARLVRERQPKLFDYALSLRNKQVAARALALGSGKPLLHVSGMFGNRHGCASLILPLCMHPVNKNAVVCVDLRYAPDELLSLPADEIRQRLYTSQAQLEADGHQRIALKNVHLNKSPMLVPVAMVTDEVAARAGLDLSTVRRHYDQLIANSSLAEKLQQVFSADLSASRPVQDVDLQLYDGFFPDADKVVMREIRHSSPQQLAGSGFMFQDSRLGEMLFRYRARNWPESLDAEETQRWLVHCRQRLTDPATAAGITLDAYLQQLESLYELYQEDAGKLAILEQLMDWPEQLLG